MDEQEESQEFLAIREIGAFSDRKFIGSEDRLKTETIPLRPDLARRDCFFPIITGLQMPALSFWDSFDQKNFLPLNRHDSEHVQNRTDQNDHQENRRNVTDDDIVHITHDKF